MAEEVKTTEGNKAQGVGETTGNQASQNKDGGEKTFTQEDYNNFEAKIRKEYAEKYSGIDVKKYREWEESQKTAEQKAAEKAEEYAKKDEKISNLEKENAVYKAGVSSEDVDYVVFAVSKQEGNFAENLAKFLIENPKYKSSEKIVKTIGTSAKLENGTRTETTTNQIMNDLIRNGRK